jgi:Tol biopolymer transport system component
VKTSPRHLGRLAVAALLVLIATSCSGKDSKSEPDEGDPAVSRDGKWIAFSGDGIHIAKLGAAARRITDPGTGTDAGPAWSPDGSRIVFARSADNATSRGLYLVNRDGSGLRRLTKRDDGGPSWSPDGKRIAFTHSLGTLSLRSHVRVIDADGKNERVLLHGADSPDWSPDGSRIAFTWAFGNAIAVLDLKTKRSKRVIRSKTSPGSPAWSPDGTQIAFFDFTVPSDTSFIDIPEIYVVNVDGTGLRRLTRDTEYDSDPTWTPDGRIVFASYREGSSRLYIMNRDGTGLRRFPSLAPR